MKLFLEVSTTFVNIDVLGSLKDTLLGIGIVFMMLAILIAVVTLIGVVGKGKKKTAAAPAEPKTEAPKAPSYPDTVELYGTDEKTAAMIMAIVASESGIPANELRFISIREM